MKLLWILAEDSQAQTRLSQLLTQDRFNCRYEIRTTSSLTDVPEAHFSQSGIAFLLDAFSAKHPGFEGVKFLHGKNFHGPIFLFGEPAATETDVAFLQHGLSGFLPPFDRCDWALAAGLIHSAFHYSGKAEPNKFLEHGGRSAMEVISDMKSLNAFAQKLVSFVSKFGLDSHKVKRSLVALAAPYVDHSSGQAQIKGSFELHYAIDPGKLLIGVRSPFQSNQKNQYAQDFVHSIMQSKGVLPAEVKIKRQDFSTTSKLSGNLLFLFGSADGKEQTHSHVFSMLPFPRKTHVTAEPYFFAFIEARPYGDFTENLGAPAVEEDLKQSPETLFDPVITGDLPAKHLSSITPPTEEPNRTIDLEAQGFDPASAAKVEELERKLRESQTLIDAMEKDLRRLLKERREPSTPAEAKEALHEANERIKRMQAQSKLTEELIKQKEEQIQNLKAQVDRMKMTAA